MFYAKVAGENFPVQARDVKLKKKLAYEMIFALAWG